MKYICLMLTSDFFQVFDFPVSVLVRRFRFRMFWLSTITEKTFIVEVRILCSKISNIKVNVRLVKNRALQQANTWTFQSVASSSTWNESTSH